MKEELRVDLLNSWTYIQGKIDYIIGLPSIDIKQISDLQRYIDMQKNIAHSLALLMEVE